MVDIFQKKPPVDAKREGIASMPEAAPITEDMTRLTARLKIAEERYGELRKKLLLIEQNMLSHHKKEMNEIKLLNSDITEINSRINMIEDRILMIVKELKLTARKEDIAVMKKYVELWNPMRFATKEQVENIVKEALGKEKEPAKKE
ncbi:hypothetical protein KY346_03260 [Candidatus Woesearchaeota archaeon]|nr:hypothetical protein [Candidatus Woesearchaeota archaeon]